MKLNKQVYFSVFFLVCFIASFSANVYKGVNTSVSRSHIKHDSILSFSVNDTKSSTDNEFLFEENEDSSENAFHTPASVLPYFLSAYQYEVIQPVVFSEQSAFEKLSKPIYISVRNFRI